jgi:pimeloyl-ACP methyl ester carboxylesterase
MILAKFREPSGRRETMQLNFHVEGDGVPLIILHGFLGSSDNWRAMSKRFAALFKVYCLDLRNHGGSPHSQAMNFPAMAEDLREFFVSKHIDQAHLIGHSMGGKVTMQFAVNESHSVDKLVVIDIAPKAYPPAHRPLLTALKALELGGCKTYGDVARALEEAICETQVRQFMLKNLGRGADASFHWRIGLDEIIWNYDALTEAVSADRAVANPTCFIRAGRSVFIADGDIPQIRQMFANVEIVTIADAGHWLHIEAADQFYQMVIGFLLANS